MSLSGLTFLISCTVLGELLWKLDPVVHDPTSFQFLSREKDKTARGGWPTATNIARTQNVALVHINVC